MKLLLSIFFLFVLVGRSKAVENFDNKNEISSVWISGEIYHTSINLESGICDEQDFNDFNGPGLFIDKKDPEFYTTKYTTNLVYVILPSTFTYLLQNSLIDLPPPSFS